MFAEETQDGIVKGKNLLASVCSRLDGQNPLPDDLRPLGTDLSVGRNFLHKLRLSSAELLFLRLTFNNSRNTLEILNCPCFLSGHAFNSIIPHIALIYLFERGLQVVVKSEGIVYCYDYAYLIWLAKYNAYDGMANFLTDKKISSRPELVLMLATRIFRQENYGPKILAPFFPRPHERIGKLMAFNDTLDVCFLQPDGMPGTIVSKIAMLTVGIDNFQWPDFKESKPASISAMIRRGVIHALFRLSVAIFKASGSHLRDVRCTDQVFLDCYEDFMLLKSTRRQTKEIQAEINWILEDVCDHIVHPSPSLPALEIYSSEPSSLLELTPSPLSFLGEDLLDFPLDDFDLGFGFGGFSNSCTTTTNDEVMPNFQVEEKVSIKSEIPESPPPNDEATTVRRSEREKLLEKKQDQKERKRQRDTARAYMNKCRSLDPFFLTDDMFVNN